MPGKRMHMRARNRSAAELQELNDWTTAVNGRIAVRMGELAAAGKATGRRPFRPDCSVAALAMQDVLLCILDPNDTSGLQTVLPGITTRAQRHLYAPEVLAELRATKGKPRLIGGAWGTAAMIIPDVNTALYVNDQEPSDTQESLQDAAEFRRPNPLKRALAQQTGMYAVTQAAVLGTSTEQLLEPAA